MTTKTHLISIELFQKCTKMPFSHLQTQNALPKNLFSSTLVEKITCLPHLVLYTLHGSRTSLVDRLQDFEDIGKHRDISSWNKLKKNAYQGKYCMTPAAEKIEIIRTNMPMLCKRKGKYFGY